MYMILLTVFYYYVKATKSNKYGYGLFKGHKTISDIQKFSLQRFIIALKKLKVLQKNN